MGDNRISTQVKLALIGDLGEFAHQTHLRIARGARNAAEKQLARGKLALRGDVRAAGLGDRLANTWRAEVYPKSAAQRTHAPAVVFRVNDRAKTQRPDSLGNVSTIASAADIIKAHTFGPTIVSKNGLYMALPTANTPRKGRRYATPHEVETDFNQDLIVLHGRGQQMLAFVDATPAKSGRGFRPATKRRTQAGRQSQLTLMFVLVRQVTLRAKLHWPQIFEDLQQGWEQLFPAEIAAALNEGPA
jgi:hypothetical protein